MDQETTTTEIRNEVFRLMEQLNKLHIMVSEARLGELTGDAMEIAKSLSTANSDLQWLIRIFETLKKVSL